MLQTPCCMLQAHAPCYSLQATCYRLQASGSRLHAPGYRLQATGYRLQATGYRLQAPIVVVVPYSFGGVFAHDFSQPSHTHFHPFSQTADMKTLQFQRMCTGSLITTVWGWNVESGMQTMSFGKMLLLPANCTIAVCIAKGFRHDEVWWYSTCIEPLTINGVNVWSFFGLCIWKMCVKNRFKSSGELFWSILV